MGEILNKIYEMTAIGSIVADPRFLIMYALAFVLLYLGIKKEFEPLLLVPIAFGVLIANFPGGGMGVLGADGEGFQTWRRPPSAPPWSRQSTSACSGKKPGTSSSPPAATPSIC